MSAAIHLHEPSPAEFAAVPQPFGLLPRNPYLDPNFGARERIGLAALVLIACGRASFTTDNATIALYCGGMSERWVQCMLADLERGGHIIRTSIGPRFTFRFELLKGSSSTLPMPRGGAPPCAPRRTVVRPEAHGGAPPPPRAYKEAPASEEREKRDREENLLTHVFVNSHACVGEKESVSQSSFSFSRTVTEETYEVQDQRHQEVVVQPLTLPSLPFPLPEPEAYALADEAPPTPPPAPVAAPVVIAPAPIAPAAPEAEVVSGLLARAAAVLGVVSRQQVADALRDHGRDKVEMAVRQIEEPGSPARGWGYVLTILGAWRRDGTIVKIPAPKPPDARKVTVTVEINRNPGIGRKDVEPTSAEAAALLRETMRAVRSSPLPAGPPRPGKPLPPPPGQPYPPPPPSPPRAREPALKLRDDPGFLALEAELEAAERARRAAAMAPAATRDGSAGAPSDRMPARLRRRRPAPLIRKRSM